MLLWLQNRQVKQFRKQVGGNVCICSLNNRTALVHKHLKSLTRTVNNEIYNEQQPWLRQGLYSVKLPFLQYGSPSSRNTGSQPKWSVSRDASDGCCSHTAAWKVLRSCPATSQAISLARFSAVPNGWDLASSMDASQEAVRASLSSVHAATRFEVKNSMTGILPAPPREKLRAGVKLGWKRCSTPFKKPHLLLRDNLLN